LASPIRTGDSRTEPTSSVPTRAVNETSAMGDLLAQAIRGLGVAAGPERALVQPVDRRRIFRRLRLNGQGNVGCRRVVRHRDPKMTENGPPRLFYPGRPRFAEAIRHDLCVSVKSARARPLLFRPIND
jgi:hypothetical protein